MDPDSSPEALQRKVQFDIRLYFFRRGSENMESMKKDDFKLDFNKNTETWLVTKQHDELTKNHQEIRNKIAGVMPENTSDLKTCPVHSFVMYTEHLNPENPFLWQTPLKKVDMQQDVVWYGKGHVGKNPLAKFMSEVSKNCGLSKIYTNHCIRVTGATILTRTKFSASEIMSVTGHKSIQSLAIYQKTGEKTKKEMGTMIGQAMSTKDDQLSRAALQQCQPMPALPAPPLMPPRPMANAVENKENATNEIIPYDPNLQEDQPAPSFDLGQILNEVMNEPQPTTVSNTQNVTNNNVPRSMFHGCHIGNITFNLIPKQN